MKNPKNKTTRRKEIRKADHPEYKVWSRMHERCKNPNDASFHRYGGRGIAVCPEWKTFEKFLEDMGSRPTAKHSIDRIDNNTGYSKENCRWADSRTQVLNSTIVRMITYKGLTQPLTDWALQNGIHPTTLTYRLKVGIPMERALQKKKLHKEKKQHMRDFWLVFDTVDTPSGSTTLTSIHFSKPELIPRAQTEIVHVREMKR